MARLDDANRRSIREWPRLVKSTLLSREPKSRNDDGLESNIYGTLHYGQAWPIMIVVASIPAQDSNPADDLYGY